MFSCNNDDNEPQIVQDVYEGCCSPEPVFGPNINNLDQTLGEIKIINLFSCLSFK